jgi:asparagine synthase (glutamine-hydrolysing)
MTKSTTTEIYGRAGNRGYHFQSQSDTEVLLHLYAESGVGMASELRVMYALAIWDENNWLLEIHSA